MLAKNQSEASEPSVVVYHTFVKVSVIRILFEIQIFKEEAIVELQLNRTKHCPFTTDFVKVEGAAKKEVLEVATVAIIIKILKQNTNLLPVSQSKQDLDL